MRTCPTCDRPRRKRQVMCRICWHLVPRVIKKAVREAGKFRDTIEVRIALRQAITAVRRLTI